MEYKDIETFLEIVRTRNITKAAENMFLSQSTISNRLKHLEDELGYCLLQRAKGQRLIQLTQHGKEFIPIAERWKKLFEETILLKKKNVQILRIATNESAYYEIIEPFLIEFLRIHIDLKLSIQICDTAYIYDLAEANLIDYGFASFESARNEIISRCINTQKICIIQYRENPTLLKKIHPSELDISKEIRFTGGHFETFNSWYNKWFENPYAFHMSINSPYAALPLLKEFHGWMLCPYYLARILSKIINLQIYELEEAPKDRKIYMIQRKDSGLKNFDIGKIFEKSLWEYLDKLDYR
ncbi:TPA: LysR family transcriptional regulator [Clostridioides difficile]